MVEHSSWRGKSVHSLCDPCMQALLRRAKLGRESKTEAQVQAAIYRFRPEYIRPEICCLCQERTTSGIYYRSSLAATLSLNCGGKHNVS